MFSPLMKFSCAVAICCLVVLGGCNAVESESAQADRQVREYLAAGNLAKAADVKGASASVRARVLGLQAAAEIAKARATQTIIDDNAAKVRHLSSEMVLMADSIHGATLLADAAKKLDPATFQKVAKDRMEQLGGKGAPEWFKAGEVAIATKATLDQRLAALQADAKKLEDQKATAQAQRNKLLADADSLIATPSADSKESLDKHRKATEMRKQAGDFGVDIDKIDAQLLPLQQDAEVAKAEIAAIEKTINDLQQHSDAAGKAWADIRKNTGEQTGDAAKLASGASATTQPDNRSIAQAASAMDEAYTKATAAIDEAAKNLSTAASYSEQAAKLAGDYGAEIRGQKSSREQSSMVGDWNLLEAAINPVNYQLDRAALLRAQAQLTTTRADLIATRADAAAAVASILTAAALPVPPALQGDPAAAKKEIADAYAAAIEQIDASAKQLDGLAVIGADEHVEADKNIQTVLNNFALARIYRSTGDTQKADSLQAAAVTLAKDLSAKAVPIPTLPVQIKEPAAPQAPPTPPAPPVAEPTTTPAATPAAPPADAESPN